MKDEFKEEKVNVDDFEKRTNGNQEGGDLSLHEKENDIESRAMIESIINETLRYYDKSR